MGSNPIRATEFLSKLAPFHRPAGPPESWVAISHDERDHFGARRPGTKCHAVGSAIAASATLYA